MFSFRKVCIILAAAVIGAQSSGVPGPVLAPAPVVEAPIFARAVAPAHPVHVGYTHAIPDNIPPYASQVSVVNRGFAAPYFAAPAPYLTGPLGAIGPGPYGFAPAPYVNGPVVGPAAPFVGPTGPFVGPTGSYVGPTGPFVGPAPLVGPAAPFVGPAPYAVPGPFLGASPYAAGPFVGPSALAAPGPYGAPLAARAPLVGPVPV